MNLMIRPFLMYLMYQLIQSFLLILRYLLTPKIPLILKIQRYQFAQMYLKFLFAQMFQQYPFDLMYPKIQKLQERPLELNPIELD
jgi:hypothetical protein